MFWVYILRCSDGSYYTGHTDNLEVRIAQHHAGECSGYTATRLPLTLVWAQECFSREEALSAERKIKGWSRKKKEAMMRGDWTEVSRLAKSKSDHPSTNSGRTDLLLQSRHVWERKVDKVIAGIGCDRNTNLETLEEALGKALRQCGLALKAIAGLASIDKKYDEAALLELAEKYAWPLYFYPAEELAQIQVPNPSEVVRKYMGTPAVAEAAALKAANTNMNDLLVEKVKHLGADGKNATVSIARIK